jgi:DNA polymerase delta subunit 1
MDDTNTNNIPLESEKYVYRGNYPVRVNSKSNTIRFQICDWYANDMEEVIDSDSNSDIESDCYKKRKYPNSYYIIRAYGVTEEGYSVCVHINDFRPYFYIRVPDYWDTQELRTFITEMRKHINFRYQQEIEYKKIRYISRKNLYGFTNNRLFKFIKVVVKSQRAFYECQRILSPREEDPDTVPNKQSCDNKVKKQAFENRMNQFMRKLNNVTNNVNIDASLINTESETFTFDNRLFESNINPLLRFIHIRNLEPSGWVEIKKNKYSIELPKQTRCQIDITTTYKNVCPLEQTMIAPLLVASFDIECTSTDGSFPQPYRPGDKVIQIGTTVRRIGDTECCLKHIVTLNDCDPIEGVEIEEYNDERRLLKGWVKFINKLDPDIITGYNIWGFDFNYLFNRAKKLNCHDDFNKMGRYIESDYDSLNDYRKNKYRTKKLSSSALGMNMLYYLEMDGRAQIDLMKLIQKDYNLDSYKLNSVSEHFMKQNKVDLPPKQLFEYFRIGTPDLIREIAIYCIQDNELCNNLLDKLSVIPNNVGMSNVCSVPFSWLFMRGQGIKIQSLVAKQCRNDKFLIPVVKKGINVFGGEMDADGYEGAIVLQPQVGLYLDEPIAVMDYASLYPSSMIAENISHDTLVVDPQYDNLPDYNYNTIQYDVYEGTGDNKRIVGQKICKFAERKDGEKAILPRILAWLLKARKDTRKKIPSEPNPFKKGILEGLQLSYKLTANSLYGQVGSSVSAIYLKELGASTTAVGRRQIYLARDETLQHFPGSECIYGDTDSVFIKFNLKYDVDGTELHLNDTEKLERTIQMGIEAANMITTKLKPPNVLEYEKSFFPFCLFSKKRYIGNLYETDPHKFKQKSMGIALKRRDYAPIVKIIYGGIMDIILNNRDLEGAKRYFVESLHKMFNGEFQLKDFIISKTLGNAYKSPHSIAHNVLAMRIGSRTGEPPASNDRIPYIFIDPCELKCNICRITVNDKKCKCLACNKLYCEAHLDMSEHMPCSIKCRMCNISLQDIEYSINTKCTKCNKDVCEDESLKTYCHYCNGGYCDDCFVNHKCITKQQCEQCKAWYCNKHLKDGTHKCSKLTNKILQGDRIENPKYIADNNTKVDYLYYLDHQIKTATLQIFGLTMENPESLISEFIPEKPARKRRIVAKKEPKQTKTVETTTKRIIVRKRGTKLIKNVE